MLVGRDVVLPVARQQTAVGDVAASLQNLQVQGDHGKEAVHDFNLDVHAGEIVGIAGVDGNGQSELIEAVVGLRAIKSGILSIGSEDVTHRPAFKRIDAGLKYVPADRKRRGVALDLSIVENSVMKNYRTAPYSVHGILKPDAMRQFASSLVEKCDICCGSIDTLVGTLSGGNMQKLFLGRETSDNPRLLVVEHPTQGLDIGAIEYVRKMLLDKRDEGIAVHECQQKEIDRDRKIQNLLCSSKAILPIAIFLAFLSGAMLLGFSGYSPFEAYGALLRGSFGTYYFQQGTGD